MAPLKLVPGTWNSSGRESMIRRFQWFRKCLPVGLYFALSSVVVSGQEPKPGSAPNVVKASSQESEQPQASQEQVAENPKDSLDVASPLAAEFRVRSAFKRAELLEQVDASPSLEQTAVVSLLQDSLYDDDPLVREVALRALIRRDSEKSPVLTEAEAEAFQGENADLAKVHFAAKYGNAARLRELIQSGDAVVQESAFEALAAQDVSDAIATLRTELQDKNSLYRLQTLELLARSAYTASWDELLPILRELGQDEDPLVRDYATLMLKEKQLEAEGSQTLLAIGQVSEKK
jgi:HEAT repeat protein